MSGPGPQPLDPRVRGTQGGSAAGGTRPQEGDRLQQGDRSYTWGSYKVQPGDNLSRVLERAVGKDDPNFRNLLELAKMQNGLGAGGGIQAGATLMVPRPEAAGTTGTQGGSAQSAGAASGESNFVAAQSGKTPRVDIDQPPSRAEWDARKPKAATGSGPPPVPVDADKIDAVKNRITERLAQGYWNEHNNAIAIKDELEKLEPAELKHLVEKLDPMDLGKMMAGLAKACDGYQIDALLRKAGQTDKKTLDRLDLAITETLRNPPEGGLSAGTERQLGNMHSKIQELRPKAPEELAIEPSKGHVVQPGDYAKVDIQPSQIQLGGDVAKRMAEKLRGTPHAAALTPQGQLDLSKFGAEAFKALDPNLRRDLMQQLSRQKVNLEASDPTGKLLTGQWKFGDKDEVSAATALGAKMWASGDSEAFARAFAAAPAQLMPILNGEGTRVLTAENIGTIMNEMSRSHSAGDRDGYEFSDTEVAALSTLVQKYIENAGESDPTRIQSAMAQLLISANRSLESQGGGAAEARMGGTLMGIVTAGMAKFFKDQDASVEFRNRMVTGIADAVAAAGSVDPITGAAIEGLKIAYGEWDQPPGNIESADRLFGRIGQNWLENPPPGWSTTDVHDALLRAQTAWKISGLS